MGYGSLHIMEILSMQCLQVDDVIAILPPAMDLVLVGVVLEDSLGGTTSDGCIKSIQVVVFSKVTI